MIQKLIRLRYGRNIRAKFHDFNLDFIFIDHLIIIFKYLIYPFEYLKRKFIYFQVKLNKENYRIVSNLNGFSEENELLYKKKKVIKLCEKIFEDFKYSDKYKLSDDYLYNLLDKKTIQRNRYLIKFALDDYLVKTATMYLGILPTIGSIKLWWTPKNKLSKGSQRFHIDQVDRKQLKLLVNIKDTFNIHGPFTFLPKRLSKKFMHTSNKPFESKTDDEIFSKFNKKDLIQHTGKSGSMIFVDSSNCYHYGGRTKKRDRLMLMIQYLPFHCVKETSDINWIDTLSHLKPYYKKNIIFNSLLTLPPSPFSKYEKK